MARLCRLLGVVLVASVASQNAASLRRLEEFKNLTLDKRENFVVFDLGEDPTPATLDPIFDELDHYKIGAIDFMIDFDEPEVMDCIGYVDDLLVKDDDSLARSKESNTDGEPSALDAYNANITNQDSDTINQMVNDVAERVAAAAVVEQHDYDQLLRAMDQVIGDECFKGL